MAANQYFPLAGRHNLVLGQNFQTPPFWGAGAGFGNPAQLRPPQLPAVTPPNDFPFLISTASANLNRSAKYPTPACHDYHR
jgi:hypothetical protein